MPLIYNEELLGTVTICQQRKNEVKPRKYKIQIRRGNCLAVFVYVYKEDNPKDPEKPWVHQLMNFFDSEQHIKNIIKSRGKADFAYMLSADRIEKIELNLYYKESNVLLKYMVQDGLKVRCYYKEPKKKK
jgi:hypothetical protein